MILNRLAEHYVDLNEMGEAPDFGWGYALVSLGILLSPTGEVLQLIPLQQTVQMGSKMVTKPQELIVPLPVVRASNIASNFLCDNATYFLGIGQKAKEKFAAAKDLHQTLLANSSNPFAKAICAFFDCWDIERAAEDPIVMPVAKLIEEGRNIVFMMHGSQMAQEDPVLQQIWNAYFMHKNEGEEQICLVSGEIEPIARLHDKIKNVPGAQSSGANLISINANAFTSYDIENMPGAPVGERSAFAYATALNILLADFDHRFDLGGTRVVYWAQGANVAAANTVGLSMVPPPQTADSELDDVFARVAAGLPVGEVTLDTRFYVLGLRPNAARVCVAFFFESTFGNMLRNIHKHYKQMEIIRPSGEKKYLTPISIMHELVNKNSSEKKPNPQLMANIMRSILLGAKYPYALFQNVLTRIRAEQGKDKITYGRAAIIKACLLQYVSSEERRHVIVGLNEESTNKPYVLGRLFAILQSAQEAANPGVNNTIKDRYFNAACATPNVAFPQILKLYESHIKKLKRDKPGMAINSQKAVQALLDKLDVEQTPFPNSLQLNDQGLFILGYYQQRQTGFKKAEQNEEVE